jgi:hypothetical protein
MTGQAHHREDERERTADDVPRPGKWHPNRGSPVAPR